MTTEKGVETLLSAWKTLPGIPIKIVGDGPLYPKLKMEIQQSRLNNIDLTGQIPREKLLALQINARFMIFPSEWYEGFRMIIVESLANNVPVIASRLGSMAEIIKDKVTGLHFNPGNAADLAAKVRWAWEHPQEMAEMGKNARQEYEKKYTAERNYELLMEIYRRALERKQKNKT